MGRATGGQHHQQRAEDEGPGTFVQNVAQGKALALGVEPFGHGVTPRAGSATWRWPRAQGSDRRGGVASAATGWWPGGLAGVDRVEVGIDRQVSRRIPPLTASASSTSPWWQASLAPGSWELLKVRCDDGRDAYAGGRRPGILLSIRRALGSRLPGHDNGRQRRRPRTVSRREAPDETRPGRDHTPARPRRLPGTTGATASARLTALCVVGGPIVVVVAGLGAGADDFLVKPTALEGSRCALLRRQVNGAAPTVLVLADLG